MDGYRVEVSSSFAEFWRYNVALMCGCFDGADTRTGFVAAEDAVADVGSGLTAPPADYPAARKAVLDIPEAARLVLCVYVVPHTLPAGNEVSECGPFPLGLRIVHTGREILKEERPINQWSGTSIELHVEGDRIGSR